MIGLALLVAWWLCLEPKHSGPEAAETKTIITLGESLLAFSFLILAAICWAGTLAPLLATPFIKFIDAVYLGGSSADKPPLTYAVAERRLQQHRWAEAAEEFDRITRLYPYEVRAYVEGIAAARRASDEELINRLKRRARVYCPEEAARLAAIS